MRPTPRQYLGVPTPAGSSLRGAQAKTYDEQGYIGQSVKIIQSICDPLLLSPVTLYAEEQTVM